jgi:hypothetical protein
MIIPLENLKKHISQTRNLRNLKDIEFPVYNLSGEPIAIDKVLFLSGKPIDDLRVKKDTLGERRLHTSITMHPINKACTSISDIIRVLKGQETWFIDKYGEVFKYIKTTQVATKSHKVKKIIKLETHCIVYLEGISYPFLEPRPPALPYARVIYYSEAPWIIVDYEQTVTKPGTKKV